MKENLFELDKNYERFSSPDVFIIKKKEDTKEEEKKEQNKK